MADTKKADERVLEEKSKQTLNYNDRLDGYGFGEADAEAEHDEEEKGVDEEEAKKYGPVDQYTFRESHLGEQHQSNEKTHKDINESP